MRLIAKIFRRFEYIVELIFKKKIISLKRTALYNVAIPRQKMSFRGGKATGPVRSYNRPFSTWNHELGIYEIPNAYVYGQEGLVFTQKGQLVVESSSIRYPKERIEAFTSERDNPRRIHGTVADLSFLMAHANYFHWMLESLPRMYLLQMLGLVPDYWYVSATDTYQKETLSMAGIAMDKVIAAQPGTFILADKVLLPSLMTNTRLIKMNGVKMGMWRYGYPFSVTFYRDILTKHISPLSPGTKRQFSKRLYISRKKALSRKIINEDQIATLLAQKGFESLVLEDLPVHDQIRAFADADVIVGPHGAGFTNIVFSKPGTKLVDIMIDIHAPNYFCILASLCDIEYYYHICPSEPSLVPEIGTVYNLHLDPTEFEALLKKAGL